MQTNRWSIQDLTRMALLAALMCASAYIAFPIPITLVNVTAQTFVLNLVALLLTKEQASVTVALWILLGAVGVPVYSGGRGGFSELAGPTGGFIVGFLIAAWLIAWLKGDNPSPAVLWYSPSSASPSSTCWAPPGTPSSHRSPSPPPC